MKLYSRLVAALLISGTFVLTASADPPLNSLFWDIDTISQAGPGGTAPAGAWDDISANWNANSDGTGIPGVWSNDPLTNAVFAAGSTGTGIYTVTMGAEEHVDGVYFKEGTVTIAPGTGALFLEGTGIFDVASGASGTITSTIKGSTNIAKNGVGTVTLSADNTAAGFAGGLDVNNGTLSITNGGAIGLGGDFTPATVHDGGTLQVGGVALTNATPLNINGNGFNTTGAIRKTDNVAVTMSGGITLGSASRIQSERNTLTISGSPLIMGSNDLTFAGTASGNTGNITVSADIHSNAGTTITKVGQGILTLSGTNLGSLNSKFKVLGGTLSWSSDNSFTNDLGVGPAAPVADYVIVDGGTLRMTTGTTTGTSFMRSNRGIQLGPGGGTINMSSTTVAAKAIYGQGVAGSGTIGLTTGTTAATLTKTGAAEFRWNGPGTETAGFTKLVLNQGLYRLGSVTGQNFETGLGAVPVTSTPDAVEFTGTAANPAYFASSFGMTSTLAWNINRGVKFTGEGTFLGTGGVEINILGPVSGSGKLIAGSATSPYNTTGAFSTGSVRLSGNNSGFTGAVMANNGTLILNTSLSAKNFSGTDTIGDGSGTSAADVNVNGSGVVFTAGSDNTPTSFSGRIIGSGTFTKVGTGTLTLSTVGTNTWTNTAGVKINAGSLKYGNGLSGLLDTVPVTIDGTSAVAGASGTLDLTAAGVTGDTIGSLISTSGNTFGQILQGTANLTLGATAATARTYRGSIISTGGSFTKAGGTFTQNLEQGAVNNTLGAVNVNLGRLNFNGINTTGTVTVAGGTLGGTGSVSGAVNVTSGTLAPGASIGTFGQGALTMASGSTFQYELNTSGTPAADLLNVNGALSLGGATLLGDDLNASPLALGAGSKFTLMSYAGAWDSSTFNGFANGSTVAVDGINYTIKYDDTPAGSLNAGSLYSSAVTLSIPSGGCAVGDLNCDGHNDAGDYVFWRKTGGPAGDYTAWRSNFGTPPGAGSGGGLSGATVPEPSGIALLMVALAAMATRRRGR